jgi:hypothetical protein
LLFLSSGEAALRGKVIGEVERLIDWVLVVVRGMYPTAPPSNKSHVKSPHPSPLPEGEGEGMHDI